MSLAGSSAGGDSTALCLSAVASRSLRRDLGEEGATVASFAFCAAANCAVALFSDGTLALLDGSLEKAATVVRPPESDRHFRSLSYIGDHDCLALIGERVFCARRSVGGSFLLRTAAQSRPPLDAGAAPVDLEISAFELAKLLECVGLPSVRTAFAGSEQLCEKMRAKLDQLASASGETSVVLRGTADELQAFMGGLLAALRQEHVAPLAMATAAVLLERVGLLRHEPYCFDVGVDNHGFDKAVVASEAARRITFDKWPHMNYRWALPRQMAEAGFYHQPNATGDDRVMCFTCNVCLVCWEPCDEPWSEHERHSAACPFVKGEPTHNVPAALTYAALPAVEHDELGDEAAARVGTVCNCVWLPVSAPSGRLQLWHLDAVVQIPQTFSVDVGDPFVAMKTGYLVESRRPQRVTWSDDACEPSVADADVCEAAASVSSTSGDVVLTASCSVGRPSSASDGRVGWQMMTGSSLPAVIVAVGLAENKLRASRSPNRLADADAPPPLRIELADADTCLHRPFMLVYTIEQRSEQACATETSDAEDSAAARKKRAVVGGGGGGFVPQGGGFLPAEPGIDPADFGGQSESLETAQSMSEAELEDELAMSTFQLDEGGWEENNNNADVDEHVGFGGFVSVAPSDPLIMAPPDLPSVMIGQAVDDALGGGTLESAGAPSNANVDLLRVHYEPPSCSLSVRQCFRLPPPLDQAGYAVHSILPLSSNAAVAVIVNREAENVAAAAKTDMPSVAVVVYRLVFSNETGVQEAPASVLQLVVGARCRQALVVRSDACTDGGDSSDAVVLLLDNHELHVCHLRTGRTLYSGWSEQKFAHIALVSGNRLCATTEDGFVTLLELSCSASQNEAALDKLSAAFLADPLSVVGQIDQSRNQLLVRKALGPDVLHALWQLTRSEWAANAVPFSVGAPYCWQEVQQQQRLRKNPQHYLRDEKQTRTWRLTPDVTSWREHTFELALTGDHRVSRIDLRFVLADKRIGCPNIAVTLLQRTSADSNGLTVVAGPYRLEDSLAAEWGSGLIQMSSPVLQCGLHKSVFLRIEASLYDSESERLWKSRIEDDGAAVDEAAAQSSSYESYMKAKARPAKSSTYLWSKLPPPAPPLPFGPTASVDALNRRGCDLLEEVSIVLWRSRRVDVDNDRLERLALLSDVDCHSRLVSVAAGSSLYEQNLALDMLLWIGASADGTATAVFTHLCQKISEKMEALLSSCILNSSRSVAHKVSALLFAMLRGSVACEADTRSELTAALSTALLSLVAQTRRCRSSAGLVWLFALLSKLCRSDGAVLSTAIDRTFDVLGDVGAALRDKNDAYQMKLLTRYKLSGVALELHMYEWALPVLSYWQRPTSSQYTYANVTAGSAGAVTMYFSSEICEDEMDWAELLGVELAAHDKSSSFATPAATGNNRLQKQWLLSREHAHGLLETEPLSFACVAASDGLRVENLETGICSAIGRDAESGGGNGTDGQGPIPLPDVVQNDGMHSGNPAVAHAVSSMNQQVQSILSKQMQLLALQQQRHKLQGQLQDHASAVGAADVSVTPATQGSSASTFGVPTTPKTTPFMTPTPLSPSQMSPMNSESNLLHLVDEKDEFDSADAVLSDKPLSANLISHELLKPQAAQTLAVSKFNSGARKFVIIDFGRLVVLTDVLMPSCSDLASLSIDFWKNAESADGRRLLVCDDIGSRCLAVCDLQPAVLCRYLKARHVSPAVVSIACLLIQLTYVRRQASNSSSVKIPMGSFFGYRFVAPWQLYASATDTAERVEAAQAPVATRQLAQLGEDVQCRYELAAARLRELLDADADAPLVRLCYRQCVQLRLQWNLLVRALDRVAGRAAAFAPPLAWADCSVDQLRVTADILFRFLIRSSTFIGISKQPQYATCLTLDSAIAFFDYFCIHSTPRMQVMCANFLFQHGCGSNWWGQFFCVLVVKFFSSANASNERFVFILICCHNKALGRS